MLMSVPVAQLAGSVGLDVEVLMRLPVIDCFGDLCRRCRVNVEVLMRLPVVDRRVA